MEKDYILPNLNKNIFPHVSVFQNSDEIKATDPQNVKDVFFVILLIYLQIKNKPQKTSRNHS